VHLTDFDLSHDDFRQGLELTLSPNAFAGGRLAAFASAIPSTPVVEMAGFTNSK
jgi:hypothetical protein